MNGCEAVGHSSLVGLSLELLRLGSHSCLLHAHAPASRFKEDDTKAQKTQKHKNTKTQKHKNCLLNSCNDVAQLVTSQPCTVDMTLTSFSSHRRLELKSDRIENNSHPCAQRTLHPFCVVSHSCMVAEPVTLELWS